MGSSIVLGQHVGGLRRTQPVIGPSGKIGGLLEYLATNRCGVDCLVLTAAAAAAVSTRIPLFLRKTYDLL